MTDYTFLNLSPSEFENLSRDLLQKELKISLESFKPGKDQGIDLRGWLNKKDSIVIQCKRYTDLNDLIRVLKKESSKITLLKPKKYILTTSVALSPNNKKTISKIFDGTLHEKDIYGVNELNNILSQNPEIEKKHYKLWLASTNILQSIINNKIRVQSEIEQEHLERISKIFVSNDSYEQALEIIKKNRFVILSGNPGVGKTTLGRVLAYEFIKNEFELVVAISSIKEAFDGYAEDKNQVILFDDFLGRNMLKNRYPINEEHQLIAFIEKIAQSKNKVLILTTREYILNQAKNNYEIIKSSEIDIAKCIIDVSKYTKLIKAKILYNHLYFANLPELHIENLISSKVYLKIIEHQNYSPRIIEALIKKQDWKIVEPEGYPGILLQYFNKPYAIWESAYETDINDISKILLLILATTGTPLLKTDLEKAINKFGLQFGSKYGIVANSFTYLLSIKELLNTFITTVLDSNGEIAIEFQNPSIQDFLHDYLRNNLALQEDLIKAACFYNQLFGIFTSNSSRKAHRNNYQELILLEDNLQKVLIEKVINDFENLDFSSIYKSHYENSFFWRRAQYGLYKKLEILVSNYYSINSQMEKFTLKQFLPVAIPHKMGDMEYYSYLNVLKRLKKQINIDPAEIMDAYSDQLIFGNELRSFTEFEKIFPDYYPNYIKNSAHFREKLKEVVEREYQAADQDNFSDVIEEIETISNDFEFDAEFEIEDLTKQRNNYENATELSLDDIDFDNADEKTTYRPDINEEEVIVDLFKSLI